VATSPAWPAGRAHGCGRIRLLGADEAEPEVSFTCHDRSTSGSSSRTSDLPQSSSAASTPQLAKCQALRLAAATRTALTLKARAMRGLQEANLRRRRASQPASANVATPRLCCFERQRGRVGLEVAGDAGEAASRAAGRLAGRAQARLHPNVERAEVIIARARQQPPPPRPASPPRRRRLRPKPSPRQIVLAQRSLSGGKATASPVPSDDVSTFGGEGDGLGCRACLFADDVSRFSR
jgi:hypothetical protein